MVVVPESTELLHLGASLRFACHCSVHAKVMLLQQECFAMREVLLMQFEHECYKLLLPKQAFGVQG